MNRGFSQPKADHSSENEYIESFYIDETFGKRRTYYRITPAGLVFYKEKCEEWNLTKEVINRFIKEIE